LPYCQVHTPKLRQESHLGGTTPAVVGMKVRATEGVVQATRPAEAEKRPDNRHIHAHRAPRTASIHDPLLRTVQCVRTCLAFLAGRSRGTRARFRAGRIRARFGDRNAAGMWSHCWAFSRSSSGLSSRNCVCAILAASGALLYLLVDGFWAVLAIGLLQAAVLAPLVPLADALSLWEHQLELAQKQVDLLMQAF
jgi:hypothetical protein